MIKVLSLGAGTGEAGVIRTLNAKVLLFSTRSVIFPVNAPAQALLTHSATDRYTSRLEHTHKPDYNSGHYSSKLIAKMIPHLL